MSRFQKFRKERVKEKNSKPSIPSRRELDDYDLFLTFANSYGVGLCQNPVAYLNPELVLELGIAGVLHKFTVSCVIDIRCMAVG